MEASPSTRAPQVSSSPEPPSLRNTWQPTEDRAARSGLMRFIGFAATYGVVVFVCVARLDAISRKNVSVVLLDVCLALFMFPAAPALSVVDAWLGIQLKLLDTLLGIAMAVATYAAYIALTFFGTTARCRKRFGLAYLLFVLLLMANFAACTYIAQPPVFPEFP